MSFLIMPSKRPFDRNPSEVNGRGKRQKNANAFASHQLLNTAPGTTVFRLLCPAAKSGGVIGKGGGVIMQIRHETGAKVKVEDTVPGCDERVIIIVGSDKDAEISGERNKGDDEVDNKEEEESNIGSDEVDEEKDNVDENMGKDIINLGDSQNEKLTSSAQRALLLIFEKMFEGDVETDGDDEEGKKSSSIFVRLLVLSGQVGCLLGKGGSVIKQMSSDSGTQIRILPRDKLPTCASPSDELVQITGEVQAVKKAIQLVSQQLMDNPPREQDSFSMGKAIGPSSHQIAPLPMADMYPPVNHPFPVPAATYGVGPHHGSDFHRSIGPPISKFHESIIPGQMNIPEEVLTFRLLCSDEKVGGVIGKGGSIIKTLKHETGCDIKILDGVPDSDDRIIVISAPAHPDDRISAAQDAVLRVQSRIVTSVADGKERTVLSRLLVSSNQIGCLLGKGGAIIAEMRKFSGAHIRILGKDQIPKCASENEEVVHITGEFDAVQEALVQITSRLRHHLFRDKFMNHPSRPFPEQGPPFPPYIGRREVSPLRMFPNLGAPFHKFETAGGLPPHDERPPFLHGIHRPGMPPHGSERLPSSAPWGPQGIIDGSGPMGMSDYAGSQRRAGAFGGSASQPAVITSTTVEVVVPRALVPSIYGEDGGCLKQIRQISGAKITITEPRPGSTETVIIMSGTPEETHAAQSLLQAFVMSGTGSP